MRIVVLANAASPHTQRWAAALGGRGHEVHVVSIRAAEVPGAEVHVPGGGAGRGAVGSLLGYLRLFVRSRRLVRRLEPDVVNAHYASTHGAIAVLRRIRPLVVTVWGSDLARGDQPVRGMMRLVDRLVLRRARAVTVASQFLARVVERVAAIEARIVPFGVDTSVFRPVPRDESAVFRVGYVKHLHRRYGPDVLLEAFARFARARPDSELVMVGDGPLRAALERQAVVLGIDGMVSLVGRVRHRDLPAVLSSFDVLVNPSRSESFGVVLLEAAAAGVPVVASRVGGTPETVVDGRTGVLVTPDAPGELAGALERLAGDAELRRRMGEEGRSWVMERFEWEECVDRMESVLAEAAR